MALRYIDSMGDHYTDAQAPLKWTSTVSPIRVAGLHGYGMRGGFSKGMLFGSSTLIMEVSLKRLHAEQIFAIGDTTHGTQILVTYALDGSIKVVRFGSDPDGADFIVQTPPDLIRTGTWYHFGWKVFLHASAGTVEVRLNGETIVNVTGVRTIATAALIAGTTIGSFSVGSGGNATIFDDLVVMDDVDDGIDDPRLPGGGGFDKFVGPVSIGVKHPNGAGLLAEWVPTPTVPNDQNVDDPTPDSDTTFNSAAPDAVGDSDLFTMEPLGLDEDVVAVQSLVLARSDDGIAALATLVHDGGTTTAGPTVYQPNSYSYMHTPEPTRPDGSLWTVAAWDAIQYGYRRIV